MRDRLNPASILHSGYWSVLARCFLQDHVRRIIKLSMYFFALCLASLTVASPSSSPGVSQAAGADHKRALILYFYNNNVFTTHQFVAGINDVIRRNNLPSADVVHEYLDISPPKHPAQRSILRELLLKKYAGQQFDLIITYTSEALDFLRNEGKELSPGSPCIALFAADNEVVEDTQRRVVYIPMELDPRGTLELGLKLFPNTRKVLFVSGNTATDIVSENRARTLFAPWQGKLEFEYTSQRSVEDLMQQVVQLPRNTLIIFSNVTSDITGKSFIPRDLVTDLARIANAPILSLLSVQIDTGVVGGSMMDIERVGAMIGNMILGLESGKPLAIEPASSYIRPMFNWTQIEHWGANPDRLPADSVFINRSPTLWEQHKAAVISVMLVILVLSTMIVALLIQNRRRKVAEMSVCESAAQLAAERNLLEQRVVERTEALTQAVAFNEAILLDSPLPMGVYAANGSCVLANDAYAQLVGTTREVLLTEPPRLSRRLQLLRGWGHEDTDKLFTGSKGASGSHGARASRRA